MHECAHAKTKYYVSKYWAYLFTVLTLHLPALDVKKKKKKTSVARSSHVLLNYYHYHYHHYFHYARQKVARQEE